MRIATESVSNDTFGGFSCPIATGRLSLVRASVDGLVSVHAGYQAGEFVTRPLVFTGMRLVLNLSTSAAGSIQVELQDANGRPLPGHALADCPEIYGDKLEQVVSWKRGPDVKQFAGQPVRLRFVLTDADLYSIRFINEQQ